MSVRTRHKLFSVSGVVARVLIAASKVSPEPVDLLVAASFGVVEVLGAKRLWKVVGPALKKQLKEMIRASVPNKPEREKVPPSSSGPATPSATD